MRLTATLVFVVGLLMQAVVIKGQEDIVETATKLNFTTLIQAITAADLVSTLKGPGPFTVFLPTDAAFAKLPTGILADLLKPENKEKLVNLLKCHVIGARITAANISAMNLPTQVETLGALKPIVDKDEDKVKVNGATVVIADVTATNGIIHVIDTVLLLPTDIVQTATNLNLTTLVQAVTAADLVDTLKGNGPFTIFAPTDEAFTKLPTGSTVFDLLKPENKDKLIALLKYHVVGQLVTASTINRMTLPMQVGTLEDIKMIVDKNGDKVKVNGATVVTADVFNNNGIIHTIDTVLLPPTDIVQTAINLNLKTLVAALTAAGLVDTLKGNGSFTIFAPTDEAFTKLPTGSTVVDLLKPENKDKLIALLKYHVVGQLVTVSAINRMTLPMQVGTLEDIKMIVDKNGDKVKVNGATVVTADVFNTNGMIHAIDTVLLPPTDIVQTATNLNLTILVQAVTAAGLVDTLKGTGPFTIFAPTDEAFTKLPTGSTVVDLLKPENKDKLIALLKYHVVGQLLTASTINRMTLPADVGMLAGGSVKVSKDSNENVKINDACVTTDDVFNTNGVIHVVDKVLISGGPSGSATSFYLNQVIFTVFVSTMLFSYHLCV